MQTEYSMKISVISENLYYAGNKSQYLGLIDQFERSNACCIVIMNINLLSSHCKGKQIVTFNQFNDILMFHSKKKQRNHKKIY